MTLNDLGLDFGDLTSLVFALVAAFLFAVGSQFQNIGLATLDSRSGTAISISASAIYFWLLAPFFMEPRYWLEPAVLIFVLIGLFRPALSANLSVAGMRYLGPTLSSTLAATSPLFGTAMGMLILGELLTWPLAIGTAGIVGAVLLLSKRGKVEVNWPVWALGLPIAAAFLRSLGHVLSKIAMVDIPDPYFAGLVAFSVSAILMVGTNKIRRVPVTIDWSSTGPRWFALGGITLGTAIIFLNGALLRGDIVVVVPIIAVSPIFTMLLSIMIFRREILTTRTVATVFIVVTSVIVIALGR